MIAKNELLTTEPTVKSYVHQIIQKLGFAESAHGGRRAVSIPLNSDSHQSGGALTWRKALQVARRIEECVASTFLRLKRNCLN